MNTQNKLTCPTCGFVAKTGTGIAVHMRMAKHGQNGKSSAPPAIIPAPPPPKPVDTDSPQYHLDQAMQSLMTRKAALEQGLRERAGIENELKAIYRQIDQLREILPHPTAEAAPEAEPKTV